MQTPPTESIRSIIATRLRSFPPSSAAFCPAGPEPITTKSYTACDINLNGCIDRNAPPVYDKPRPRLPFGEGFHDASPHMSRPPGTIRPRRVALSYFSWAEEMHA